jgi:uncharacterized protein YdaU (DUF1376 family)
MGQRDNPEWFSFYPYEFISDERVLAMTLEQVGAYLLLMMSQWVNGSIPSDIPTLARILKRTTAEMEILWAGVRPCFQEHPEMPGRLVQPRLEGERAETLKRMEKARRRAETYRERKRARDATVTGRGQNGDVTKRCTVMYSSNIESPSKKEESFDAESAFGELWEAYHQKGRVKRVLSQQYFVEEIRTQATHDRVMAAVTGKWARSEKWAKGFVLTLPEWIHNRCWDEEPEPAAGVIPDAVTLPGMRPMPRADAIAMLRDYLADADEAVREWARKQLEGL